MEGETSVLVGVSGFFCFVHFDVHIALLFPLEVARVYGWERHGLKFFGPNILTCLVHMALGGFSGLCVVALEVFDIE